MRRSFDHYRRPLLDLSRTETVAACEAEGIEFWEDPHNADLRFARSRVRTRVLPVLEAELGPGVAASLARTADLLRGDMELLDDLADAALADLGDSLSVVALATHPDAVRRRVLRLAALAAGSPASELFHEHVMAMDALITDWHGQRWVDLPGHLRFLRREGLLGFERA
jgi:tRNA(Ile)-lysidine synthase